MAEKRRYYVGLSGLPGLRNRERGGLQVRRAGLLLRVPFGSWIAIKHFGQSAGRVFLAGRSFPMPITMRWHGVLGEGPRIEGEEAERGGQRKKEEKGSIPKVLGRWVVCGRDQSRKGWGNWGLGFSGRDCVSLADAPLCRDRGASSEGTRGARGKFVFLIDFRPGFQAALRWNSKEERCSFGCRAPVELLDGGG